MTSRRQPPDVGAASCPLPFSRYDTIQLAHGAGGRLSSDLIRGLFLAAFDNPALARLDDQATLELAGTRLSFTTDSYVVDPIFFPGGDIGELAVNGTVNDLCMNGARPLYLSAGLILEEGLPLADLERIVASMRTAAQEAGVEIVTGDTKVVNRGKGDKVFINTAGIGIVEHPHTIAARNVRPGDVIVLSGTIGDHGMAILSKREGLAFESPIESDTAALNDLVSAMIGAAGGHIHAMRDPTRGGLAAALNDFASSSGVAIELREGSIPVAAPVAGACELLGIDPLYVANEGKLVAAVAEVAANTLLSAMRNHPLGRNAAIVGRVGEGPAGRVTLRTALGAARLVDVPVGEQLPRIC